MKYIDAELLKTELKRLIKERDNMMKLGTYFSTSYVYEDILALIDSLQQEQPEMDLEKEFDNFLEKENAYVDDNGMISYYNGSSFNHTCDIYPIARHFFELGLKARKV